MIECVSRFPTNSWRIYYYPIGHPQPPWRLLTSGSPGFCPLFETPPKKYTRMRSYVWEESILRCTSFASWGRALKNNVLLLSFFPSILDRFFADDSELRTICGSPLYVAPEILDIGINMETVSRTVFFFSLQRFLYSSWFLFVFSTRLPWTCGASVWYFTYCYRYVNLLFTFLFCLRTFLSANKSKRCGT